MKLFKIEVHTRKKRRVLDVLVHADSKDQAEKHVASKFTGAELRHCTELPITPAHFVIAEWDTD